MRHIPVAWSVVMAVMIGGCVDGSHDRSHERLRVEVQGMPSHQVWELGVPLPVSEPGTSAEEWFANLTIEGDAEAELVETFHGQVLRVGGPTGRSSGATPPKGR